MDDKTGAVIGLGPDEYEAANKQKQNHDGWKLTVQQILEAKFGQEFGDHLLFSFHKYEDKELCCIKVQPALQPVWLNKDFFVRINDKSPKMSTQEAMAYIIKRWTTSQG